MEFIDRSDREGDITEYIAPPPPKKKKKKKHGETAQNCRRAW